MQKEPIGTPHNIWNCIKNKKSDIQKAEVKVKLKDRVTRLPLKTWDELKCSGRVNSPCSTSGTRHVNLVTNPVISNERGKDRKVRL
jgi:hypothetical protein